MSWTFVAIVCTAGAWPQCNDMLQVRIEHLTQALCERIATNYRRDYRTVQANCINKEV